MIISLETFQEKESALSQLAKYSQTTLESFTVPELRVISKAIIANNAKYKKADLIAKILEATETYKAAITKEIKKQIGDSLVAEDFTTLIKNYFKNGKDPIELSNYLKSQLLVKADNDGNYPVNLPEKYKSKNREGFAISTLGKTKVSELRNAVSFVKSELPNSEDFCNTFYNDVYNNHLKTLEKMVNTKYFEGINSIKTVDDKIKLDGQKILSWASEIIQTVADKGEVLNRGWYPLSLALALTSGRRMDEIHGETIHTDKGVNRYYELQGDKVFISQLAKNPENTSFVFSPLVDAETWLKAHQCLPENAIGLTEDKVNKIISSNISKSPTMKKVYEDLGLKSFKDSRDFYIVYRLATEYKAGLSKQYDRESDFVQSVIGHNSKASGHSYESFVIV
jgi:hypothetical protein